MQETRIRFLDIHWLFAKQNGNVVKALELERDSIVRRLKLVRTGGFEHQVDQRPGCESTGRQGAGIRKIVRHCL